MNTKSPTTESTTRTTNTATWANFYATITEPFTFIYLLVSIALLIASAFAPQSWVSVVLTALAGLMASVVGARVDRNWTALTEQTGLQASGQIAVNSLKDLFRQSVALQHITSAHLQDLSRPDLNAETSILLARRDLNEILTHASLLEAQIVSSMQNWAVAVPKVKDDIANYQDSQLKVEQTEEKIAGLEKEMAENKTSSEAEIAQAKHERDVALQELQSYKAMEREGSFNLGASLSGTAAYDFLGQIRIPPGRRIVPATFIRITGQPGDQADFPNTTPIEIAGLSDDKPKPESGDK